MAATDPQGIVYPTATAAGMAVYARLIREMSFFRAPIVATLEEAITTNPAFAMPHIAKAYLSLYMTEPRFVADAAATMAALRAVVEPGELSEIERAHIAAIEAWIGGDLHRARAILDRLGVEHPREIMALRVGHEMDFFAGATRNLRDRVARQLPAWSKDDPHYGIVLGAWAFGLEENGQYDQAEAAGLQALELNRHDAWALHAVAHAMEMRGLTGQGIRFMTEREADWAPDNLFACHNWWHKALFHLDSGDPEGALGIYDRAIMFPEQMRFAQPMLDAAALLWRMHVDGHEVADRAAPLSDDWAEILDEKPLYPFNDIHAAMAHVAAGRQERAEAVIARMERYLAAGDDGTSGWRMVHRVGLPVAQAILAFGRGDYGRTVDLLYDLRGHAHEFGGSAAQRDVLDRTLLGAAIRGRLGSMARAIAAERVALTGHNPSNWARYALALGLTGAPEAAMAQARDRADALRAAAHEAAAGAVAG